MMNRRPAMFRSSLSPLAITIHEPFVWCFTHAGKRIENREWRPEDYGITLQRGDYVALHAGKRYDIDAAIDLSIMLAEDGLRVPEPEGLDLGAFGAVARWWGVVRNVKPESSQARWRSETRWAFVFDEIWPLPTRVPARGMNKLWKIKPDDLVELCTQWGKVEAPCP